MLGDEKFMKDKKWGRSTDPMENWPLNEDGTPVAPVFLCSETGLSFNAEVAISMLNAYGIPVMKQFPLDGSFGNVVLGMSGYGTELFVPQTMLEMAQDLLSEDAQIDQEEMDNPIDEP